MSHSLARVQSWKSDWVQTRSSWAKEGVQLLQEEVVREREGEHTRAARQERVQGWLGKSSALLTHPESGLHDL